jgi:hypothetical protein
MNFEYIIPFGGPLYGLFFMIWAMPGCQARAVSLKDVYTSTGLEVRVLFRLSAFLSA